MDRVWGYRPTPSDHIRPPFRIRSLRLSAPPNAHDLLASASPIFDQGPIGSCVGHAHAGAIYTTIKAQSGWIGWLPSPDDLYRKSRCIERARMTLDPDSLPPLTDSGAIPAYCQLGISEWGILAMRRGNTPDGRVSDCDWDTVNQEPDLFMLEQGMMNLLVGQYEIAGSPSQRGLGVRQAIYGGIAVEIGSQVDTRYMHWTESDGVYNIPDYDDPNGGGHDQYIVGYEKRGDEYVYLVQNSWGDGWCMQGRIWVSEAFLGQAMDLNAIAVRKAA